jgi:hypothetical protein
MRFSRLKVGDWFFHEHDNWTWIKTSNVHAMKRNGGMNQPPIIFFENQSVNKLYWKESK